MRESPKIQLTDIARHAGLSPSGVSLALRNDPRISAPTRKRVQRIAKKLGYSAAPRQSAVNPMWRFGFVYCDPHATAFDPVQFAPVMNLLMRDSMRLRTRVEMLLVDDDITRSGARQTLLEFVGHLQGVLLFGRVHTPVLELLARVAIPAVVIGESDVSGAKAAAMKMQRVTDDPMRAGLLATHYLIRVRGRKRVAFVGGTREPNFYYDQWHRGYLLSHALAGLAIEPARILWHSRTHPVVAPLSRLIKSGARPDAIVWPDASIAEGVRDVMKEHGFTLRPEDQVFGGMSHVQLPPSFRESPQILSDLGALTREAIRRLQFVCKHAAETSAMIVLPPVTRHLSEIEPCSTTT